MTKRKLRILMFPWGIGGGAAYTGHCLVLAHHFKRDGHEVAFSNGGISHLIQKTGFQILTQNLPDSAPPENIPPYLPFTSVERVYAVGARFYRYSKLKDQYLEDARIIEQWKPDIVVVDMVATAALAARVRGIPVLSIAEADFLSPQKNAWMPWFEGDPMTLLPYPDCLSPFNQLAAEIGHSPVQSVSDLLWGDVTLVPSIAELDPVDSLPRSLPSRPLSGPSPGPLCGALSGARGKILYAGPMFWDPPWVENLTLPEKTGNEQYNIYITLGSGGMGSLEDIQKIINACARPNWNAFVSLGMGAKQSVNLPSNVKSGGFTGLQLPLQWADLVVTHGGSATVLASLLHGKPMVVIPFMSECEMNGRQYVEGTGSGLVVRYSEFHPQSKKLQFRSRYSDNADQESLSISHIERAIEEVATQSRFRESSQRIGEKLKKARLEFDFKDLTKHLLGV